MDPKSSNDNFSSSRNIDKYISKNTNLNNREKDSKLGIRNCEEPPDCSSALFNELVLDCIFGYLKVENIKECRLVCRQWNIVAYPQLRKRSSVSLFTTQNKMQSFNSTFEYSESKVPFGSVILQSDNDKQPADPWDMVMLETFFTDWQNEIRALELCNVEVYKFTTNPYKDTQVTSLCRKYLLNLDLLSNLTSLTVDCLRSKKKTKITLYVDNLKSLKFLELSNSVMLHISNSGLKITATEVKLHDIHFIRSGKILKTVLVNDFIDFNQTKKISLAQRSFTTTTKLLLDMTDNVTVDCLNLDKIEILGGKDAKWNITQLLSLSGVPWTTRNQIKFSNLEFDTLDTISILDIAALPPTIKYIKAGLLNLSAKQNLNYYLPSNFLSIITSSSYPVIFDNLQYLSLTTRMKSQKVLPLFKHCPKLTNLAYEYKNQYPNTWFCLRGFVKLKWLPPAIRRLEIRDCTRLKGNISKMPFELETLILTLDNSCETGNWYNLMDYLNCQNLVICPKNRDATLEEISSLGYYTKLKSRITRYQEGNNNVVIYAGPVALFKNCDFLTCVDISNTDLEEATKERPLVSWFRFTSAVGHVIEKSEFNKFRNLVNSDRFEIEDGEEGDE